MGVRLHKLKFFFLILFISLFFVGSVKAEDYRSDFEVNYYPSDTGDSLYTKVNFNIKITNFRSDIYVNKFSLLFPKSFEINNISASDDKGAITPILTTDETKNKIDLEFTDPNTGKDTENNFYLTFFQKNLFNTNGNVWEVILPTIDNLGTSTYKIIVNLPVNTDKKISIAKPKPDLITGNQIVWNNPSSKTLYAVFGNQQYYQTKLIYNLINPKVVPGYTDIALPPDTLYQKIYIDQLNPQPESVFIDTDGNYLARYYLNPRENKQVVFNGMVEVLAQPRSEVRELTNKQITSQQKYLLTAKSFWEINDLQKINQFRTMDDVYYYLVNNFKYNYKKITQAGNRLGAQKALDNPTNVVCTEFTDTFVALAREKGVPAREIEGYGFSADTQLRPLSLKSDVLHAWPEYYDQSKKIWISVDPTWENTSGIDYHSSFDLNHIVFAIHGKDPEYPYPAGMYKIENTRDIIINPSSQKIRETIKISVNTNNIESSINDKNSYQAKVIVDNQSNIFLYDLGFDIKAKNIAISPSKIIVDQIAPFEKKEIVVSYKALGVKTKTEGIISIANQYGNSLEKQIVITPYYYDIAVKISIVVLVVGTILIIIRLLWKRKS